MAFRVATSLLTLFSDVNAIAPGRSKISDGTIGDAAHQKRKSDHNPDQHGVVRAADVTQDPAHGADMAVIAEQLRVRRDPRAKYIIFNRRIASINTDWTWLKFKGEEATRTPPEVVPGERSDVAFELQTLLIRIGLIRDTPGNRDHFYGPETQKVIKKFQIEHSLSPDMKVGPRTWRALLALELD
jgi:hypothetical protein